MDIDKAIEILTLMGTPHFTTHKQDILAARNLAIGALNRIRAQRNLDTLLIRDPLPGETTEVKHD